jgi:hypothetical protein
VLRKVRFFFLGIPFKSQRSNIGEIWDNVNIELQYNVVGNSPSAGERARFTCRAGSSRHGFSVGGSLGDGDTGQNPKAFERMK